MAQRYRVPMEVIIEVADEQEFVERVLVRRELDNADFQASWYLPPKGAGQRRRFHMAVQAAIDWFFEVGANTPAILEQVPLWYIGGQYHREGIQPDEGRPLTYRTQVDPLDEND
jgi:hypothetical protein